MRLADARVLITGADGFIGSHVTERCLEVAASVRALCYYNSFGTAGWLDDLPAERRNEIDVRLGDVRDADSVDEAARGVDVVLHLAALIAIPYSYESPRSYIDTNVIGTCNVLQAARRHGVARVVHTSTSEVYGTPDTVPISEQHALKGQSPYSASKIGADKLCEAWAASFALPVIVLRPFNTFGPRQSARAVIPTIVQQLLAGRTQLSLGSLHPKRDFTFVADTVEAFLRAAEADAPPGTVVHLGTGKAVSVGDIVEFAAEIVGVSPSVVEDPERVRPAGSEVQVLLSDPSLAEELLGWRPTVSFADGLRQTIDWMRPRVDAERAGRYQR